MYDICAHVCFIYTYAYKIAHTRIHNTQTHIYIVCIYLQTVLNRERYYQSGRHFSRACRIKLKEKRGEKKGMRDVYRIFGFLSDILYGLLFCLIIVHLTNFVDPFLFDVRSGGTAEECGDATGGTVRDCVVLCILQLHVLSHKWFLFLLLSRWSYRSVPYAGC